MPIFNLTIEDTSPLIRYDPPAAWNDSLHSDPSYTRYCKDTFHATGQMGAKAALTFNGSAVYIFGAFRANHDTYAVTLDGQRTIRNGHANGTDQFQQLMFSAENLGPKPHNLVLANNYTTTNASWVDVDYILLTSGDGNPHTQSHDITLDDGHPSIKYSNGWGDTPNGLTKTYYNNTLHVTNQTGASATISFEGNAITMYGAISDNHGQYTVDLDSGLSVQFTGAAPQGVFRPGNMLYFAGGLSNSTHTVQIKNIDPSPGHYLDLDKIVVSKWGEWGDMTGFATSSHSKSHVGAIVGGVVGGIAGLIGILLVSFFLYRARQRQKYSDGITKSENGPMMIEPFDSFRNEPTSASAVPRGSSAGNTSQQMLVGASQAGHTEDSSTYGQRSTLPQASKQNLSSGPPSSTSTGPTSNSGPTGATSVNHPTVPSTLNEDTAGDVPPPNYAEATAQDP